MAFTHKLNNLPKQVAEGEGFAQPSDAQLEFTLKLFDLNQDGRLSTDEMLTSLALDAVVGCVTRGCQIESFGCLRL